jgi:hypothetical protein
MQEPKKIDFDRNVNIKDFVLYYVVTISIYVLVWTAFTIIHFVAGFGQLWALTLLGAVVVTILFLRNHIIGLILFYQLVAPKELRSRCRYTPSCSAYTILAIKKYGLFEGLVKGFKRFKSCHPPFGGEDYP